MTIDFADHASRPSWGIASMVDEPLPLLLAFVAHHLDQGAAEIQLFPDRDDPSLEAAMASESRVRIMRHDARRRWCKATRPDSLALRQRQTAASAFTRVEADWMLFCDADEFVTDGAALVRELAAAPDTVQAMRLSVRERVFTGTEPGRHIFEGNFRRPIGPKVDSQKVYGDNARYLNRGMVGHSAGKTLYRRGINVDIGLHKGQKPRKLGGGPLDSVDVQEASLLHFDGLTALNWAIKLRRKSLSQNPQDGQRRRHPGRLAQIEHVQGGTMQDCLDLFTSLTSLPDALAARLDRRGVLERMMFDPRQKVAKIWPGIDVEAAFAPAVYDDLLRARYAEVLD